MKPTLLHRTWNSWDSGSWRLWRTTPNSLLVMWLSLSSPSSLWSWKSARRYLFLSSPPLQLPSRPTTPSLLVITPISSSSLFLSLSSLTPAFSTLSLSSAGSRSLDPGCIHPSMSSTIWRTQPWIPSASYFFSTLPSSMLSFPLLTAVVSSTSLFLLSTTSSPSATSSDSRTTVAKRSFLIVLSAPIYSVSSLSILPYLVLDLAEQSKKWKRRANASWFSRKRRTWNKPRSGRTLPMGSIKHSISWFVLLLASLFTTFLSISGFISFRIPSPLSLFSSFFLICSSSTALVV